MKLFIDPECNDVSLESVTPEEVLDLQKLVEMLVKGNRSLKLGPIRSVAGSVKVWLMPSEDSN